ncbi:MAG: tetratricopeptide repeat protein [Nitrospinota bacterium]
MIEGIYYEQKAMETGTMGTRQTSAETHALHYWLKENENGDVDIYYLKPDSTPTAIVVETIAKDDFEKRFKDCSTHACEFKKKTPEEKKAEAAEKKIQLGEKHLAKNEFNAATFEFGQALKVDNQNLNAHFGKGKAHIALGETDKAKEHFNKMAHNKELYTEEHKHIFNELGITLRRNGMYEEAVSNYKKALDIDTNDEALYYNMARAYKEWGKSPEALTNIQKAIQLNPGFAEALNFFKTLQ